MKSFQFSGILALFSLLAATAVHASPVSSPADIPLCDTKPIWRQDCIGPDGQVLHN
ncbi:hypothetical protein MYU51_006649 [Penicillium brevicompactum]